MYDLQPGINNKYVSWIRNRCLVCRISRAPRSLRIIIILSKTVSFFALLLLRPLSFPCRSRFFFRFTCLSFRLTNPEMCVSAFFIFSLRCEHLFQLLRNRCDVFLFHPRPGSWECLHGVPRYYYTYTIRG